MYSKEYAIESAMRTLISAAQLHAEMVNTAEILASSRLGKEANQLRDLMKFTDIHALEQELKAQYPPRLWNILFEKLKPGVEQVNPRENITIDYGDDD